MAHVYLQRAALMLAIATLVACARLPSLDGRSTSTALVQTDDTRLGRAIAPRAARHTGQSGVYPLVEARDAFAARVLLARAAERSLDVQYYIWHEDMSGTLLFEALHEAAERGVRVRMLLDDNNTAGLDATLAGLDAHPNIEVRLFNPFAIRSPRWIGYLTDFSRLNRRMHNKSFTADNQATIIGGRNVGDEYFDAADGLVYVDLDVLAVGSVVKHVSADFDRYWASGSSYPVDRLLPPARPDDAKRLETASSLVERDPAAAAYMRALRTTPFVSELIEGRLALEWTTTRMVSDDPAKGLGLAPTVDFVPDNLREAVGEPRSRLDMITSYFVPAEAGTQSLTALAASGVTLRILTNSLEATDVAVVHAGYAKRRKALLEAGITIYELKSLSPDSARRSARLAGSAGSSASALHAKTFAVDGTRVYIGSFNFDPRSANLNTELGFVIESGAFAKDISAAFEARIPQRAYRVQMAGDGALYWIERRGAEEVRHDTEPGTSIWQRLGVRLLSLLPVEWLL